MEDGVPHVVIVSNVVGTQYIQGFCVLTERTTVVPNLFLLVAH